MVLPLDLSYGLWAQLWALSLPTYIVMVLPACYFASVVYNHIQWANTQQSLVFSAIGWSYDQRWLSICQHSLLILIALFMLQGFLEPWSRQYESMLLKDAIAKPWTWHLAPGYFGHVQLGDKKMLAYKFDDKQDMRVFLIPPDQDDKLHWFYVNDFGVNGGIYPSLDLQQGQSVMVSDSKVLTTMDFSQVEMPIVASSINFLSNNEQFVDTFSLLSNMDFTRFSILLWRFNIVLFFMGLLLSCYILLTDVHCRQYAKRIAVVMCFVYVTYFFAIMWAKAAVVSYAYIWCYLLAHAYVLGISLLLATAAGAMEHWQ